jgi:transcriptional antiterminator RfaH
MMADCSSRWYVVQTQARAETKAAIHLDRQGFSTYFPRYLKRRRHARRIETVVAPLFPRYLFVAVDMMSQRWRSIHSTIGVMQLVCNGQAPAAVETRIIDALKGRENELGFIQLSQRPQFQPGEKLRVLDGVFCDSLGLFEDATDNERVTILLDLLGRKVRVVLDADSVAVA